MLSLRLFRPFARRSTRARRRPAPRRPRLAFECLETRDMLAAVMGPVALPLPPVVHSGMSNPAPRVDAPAAVPAAAPSVAAAVDNDDHAPIFVTAVAEVRVTVVVVVVFEMPSPVFVRAIDTLLHESDRIALDRIPAVPTATAPITALDHAAVSTADSTAPPASRLSAPANAINAPPIGNITVPLNLPQLAVATLTTQLAALDQWARTSQFLANIQPQRPSGQLLTFGVPRPTEVSAAESAYPPAGAASSVPAPAVAPWLAGLLTPIMQFDPAEPLQVFEQLASTVPTWGRGLASSVASLITSPWTAGAAIAVAAVELVRRRARRARRVEVNALEVPTITGPSQLI